MFMMSGANSGFQTSYIDCYSYYIFRFKTDKAD